VASRDISAIRLRHPPGGSAILARRAAEMLHERRPDLLKGLDGAAFQDFLATCSLHHHPKPHEILRQDEPTDHCYLILQGRVEVSVIDVNGNRVLAHIANPGEVMGEVEIFSGRVCAATCTTWPDTMLAAFSAEKIMACLPAETLLRNFAGIFHDRLTRDNAQQSVAMFYAAEDRIRIHLLSLTAPDRPEALISQNNLALLAGCSRQTVNQTLAHLRGAGIVEITRGTIRVLDRARLQGPRPGSDLTALPQTTVPREDGA